MTYCVSLINWNNFCGRCISNFMSNELPDTSICMITSYVSGCTPCILILPRQFWQSYGHMSVEAHMILAKLVIDLKSTFWHCWLTNIWLLPRQQCFESCKSFNHSLDQNESISDTLEKYTVIHCNRMVSYGQYNNYSSISWKTKANTYNKLYCFLIF